MKVFTFGNFKGGTGKSSLAGIAALQLSRKGKVLVVDLDYQANLTTMFRANYNAKVDNKSIFNLFRRQSITRNIVKISDKIDLLPAAIELDKHEVKLNWLSSRLEKIAKKYDYCVIDTRPDIDSLVQSAIYYSDKVIVVMEPTFISLSGALTYAEQIKYLNNTNDLNVNISFIINKFDKRNTAHVEFLKECGLDKYKIIPYSNRINRYSNTGLPKDLDYHDNRVLERRLDE